MTREPTVLTLSAPAIRYLRVRKRIILLLCLGGGEIGEKVGGPVEAGTDEEASGEIRLTALGDHRVDTRLGGRVGGAEKRQCDRTEAQLEEPVAARRLQVILALGRCPADLAGVGSATGRRRVVQDVETSG